MELEFEDNVYNEALYELTDNKRKAEDLMIELPVKKAKRKASKNVSPNTNQDEPAFANDEYGKQ